MDGRGRRLRGGRGYSRVPRPHLAWGEDTDRLEEVLGGGALGKNSATPRLQSFDGPSFVSVGARHDHPWPHTIQAKLPADLEGPRGLSVHKEDLGNATPQCFAHGGCRDLAHHEERTIRAEEATEAGPEKGADTQEHDADRRGRNRRRRGLCAGDNAMTVIRRLPA